MRRNPTRERVQTGGGIDCARCASGHLSACLAALRRTGLSMHRVEDCPSSLAASAVGSSRPMAQSSRGGVAAYQYWGLGSVQAERGTTRSHRRSSCCQASLNCVLFACALTAADRRRMGFDAVQRTLDDSRSVARRRTRILHDLLDSQREQRPGFKSSRVCKLPSKSGKAGSDSASAAKPHRSAKMHSKYKLAPRAWDVARPGPRGDAQIMEKSSRTIFADGASRFLDYL